MRFALRLLALLFVSSLSFAQVPDRSTTVSKDVVDDEFIAYLFSLLLHDYDASIPGDRLRELFPEYDDGAVTPIDFIELLERRSGSPGTIRLVFEHEVEHPAPIDILGYRPVMLFSTASLEFREVYYPTGSQPGASVEAAYALFVEDGEFGVDFDGWLDFLLGSMVDDVDVGVVLAVRYEDRWYGAMAGYNPELETVTGVYDMGRGRFLARPPAEIVSFAIDRLEE